MRAIHKIAVLGAAVVAFGTVGAGTALADPYPPLSSPPPLTSIEGVGSDTITPLFSGNETYVNGVASGGQTSGDITQDYDATDPSNLLYSWDAVNPSTGATGDTITTKASSSSDTTCSIARPDGSSAGITALNLNTEDDGDYCIDYARSSRAPNTTTFDDSFAALATDAIAWSDPLVSGETSPAPASLTQAQLVDIYTCVDTNWDQVGGADAPIVPVIPQSGSGTRATWLAALGIPSTTVESCWINGTDPFSTASPAPVIEENTGLSPGNEDVFDHSGTFDWPLGQTTTTADSADVIFPYSIGDWIAQTTPAVEGTGAAGTPGGASVGGHATDIWGQGNLSLGETVSPILGVGEEPVTTNSDGQPVINPEWSSQFDRTLYDVVRNGYSDPTSSTDASWPTGSDSTALQDIFGPNGWICTNATAQSDIVSYGFGLESSANCGALTAGD
jgi:ABC-type phosphate transport system substrate-binding protein